MGATLRIFPKKAGPGIIASCQLRLMNVDSLDLESGYESERNNVKSGD